MKKIIKKSKIKISYPNLRCPGHVWNIIDLGIEVLSQANLFESRAMVGTF